MRLHEKMRSVQKLEVLSAVRQRITSAYYRLLINKAIMNKKGQVSIGGIIINKIEIQCSQKEMMLRR